MELYEVVNKLVGPIEPIGETNADNLSFENLIAMTNLVDKLLFAIDRVSTLKDRPEYSVKRSGELAHKFINDVRAN
jgi:hypothetical protein